jgi:hypothetical protein
MTKQFFLAKLARQFDKINADSIADIGDFLGTLTEENIRKLWDAFETEYLLQSPPRKGHLRKIASGAGIFSEDRGDRPKYVSVCYSCAANGKDHTFPADVFPCPRCGCGFGPWIAVGYAGNKVSAERAALILHQNPQGPHPRMGIKKLVSHAKPQIGAAIDAVF